MSRSLQNGLELSAAEKRALLADLLRQQAARARTAPLSFAQQRLWLLAQLEPASAAYNIPRALRLQGALNVPALRQTFNTIIARHEVLRSSLELVDGDPVQRISAHLVIDLPLVDLEALPESDRDQEVNRLAAAEAQQPFDLTRAPLLRTTLLKLGDQDHVLLLTIHHIVSDGWSLGVLVRELATIYQSIIEQRSIDVPALPIQYADFARWQREWLQGEVLEEQLGYWQRQLADAPVVLNLPVANPRAAMQTFNGGHGFRKLSPMLSSALGNISRREGATLFMTLLAVFQTLLYRYSGQEDLVIGTPIAGRNRAETEGLIGFFVNTLPLRTSLAGDPTFRDLLRRTRETALGGYAHQDLPFEKIVEEMQPERSLSHSPLFQVMFALQNQPKSGLSLPGIKVSLLERTTDFSKFDLSLFTAEYEDGLTCWLEYNSDLFTASTIDRLLGHYEVLLEGVVANPDRRLSELPLLTEAERHEALVVWNDTRVDFQTQQCIHQLFETQTAKTPEAIALVCGSERLTYRELNTRANQLAHYLQRLGIGPEDRVGVCLRRTPAMLVAILGTLKAGGAYVPLDPAYPRERLAFTLGDAGAKVLLTQAELLATLTETKSRIVCVDADRKNYTRQDKENVVSGVTPQNLAYVIYTSGSTGVPKGVAIAHASTATFLQWAIATFDKRELASVLASTSICFDLSVFEMFAPLCAGGKVVLVENALQLPELRASDITLINTVPSAMAELVRVGGIPSSVRTINLAGEPLTNKLTQDIYQQETVQQVLNLYGPSEDTTYSTFVRLIKGATEEPSIGRPVANTEVYLLDRFSQPVPVGVPGELHLGGDGLARGYLNRPALTAEKFVPHPFSSEPAARLYRTGDLARYQSDGVIQFLGRMDHQVKLRGYRIELGEIETILRTHAAVQDAVAVVRDFGEGNRNLVGYVVIAAGAAPAKLADELKSFLKNKLPDYMVPAFFVELDQLPLTPNGKVDRQALPAPGLLSSASANAARPRSEIELRLTLIWERVLNTRSIGLTDNFFELGGHSLLAVRLMAEIEKDFGQKIPLISLFQSATIESLAGILQQGVSSIDWPVVVEIQRGSSMYPLFCVSHPGVNALGYLSLARYLDPDQPVFGLQSPYPEDLQGEHSQTAVDELATEYLSAIRVVQPHGPYQLAGMCRGAHIAFEIARRLEQEGETVALVGILDTWVLENTYNSLLFVEYYLRRLTSMLRGRKKESKAIVEAGATGAQTAIADAPIRKNPVYEVYFPGPEFVPKTYSGSVHVFRARRQPLNRIRDAQLGWGRLADGGAEVHMIPGRHGNVLREPNVKGLAAELKKCLLGNQTEETHA